MHNLCCISIEAKHYLHTGDAAVNAIVLESCPLGSRGLEELGSGAGTLRMESCARRLLKVAQLLLKGSALKALAFELQLASKRGEACVELDP